MSTTVHLPPELLDSVDRRARELEMSRNRYIIRALERALEDEKAWSPRFLEALLRLEILPVFQRRSALPAPKMTANSDIAICGTRH